MTMHCDERKNDPQATRVSWAKVGNLRRDSRVRSPTGYEPPLSPCEPSKLTQPRGCTSRKREELRELQVCSQNQAPTIYATYISPSRAAVTQGAAMVSSFGGTCGRAS